MWRTMRSLSLVLLALSSISAQDACKTPRDKAGSCIVIDQCKELNDLLQNRYRTPDETRFLRSSQCGQEGRTPKVCCELGPGAAPLTQGCFTPDNVQGRCVGIYKCPTLEPLLRLPKPLPQDVVAYLRRSACQGAERYSVCCSDQPPSVRPQPQADFQSLLYPDCGLESDQDRIVGGEEAEITQYPWMGIIEYQNKGGRILQSCAGSLIAKKYVVTAAHCVAGAVLNVVGTPVNVRFGEFDKTNPGQDCVPVAGGGQDCTDEPVVIPIEQYIPHPEFEKGTGPKNDIAVIRLSREAPYTDFIRPICLPDSDRTVGLATSQMQLTVAGWGTTETGRASAKKLHLKMPFVDLDTCQNAFVQSGLQVTMWNKQLCAGGLAGKDSCRGDSGGPLMHSIGVKYNLIGVVSYGPTPCGKEGVPGVYSKIFAYLDWIKAQMRP